MLKENPLTCEEDSVTNTVSIYIEQMYSPVTTRKRSEMLRKRWQLKQQHPDWEVFPAYPAKLLRRTAQMGTLNKFQRQYYEHALNKDNTSQILY